MTIWYVYDCIWYIIDHHWYIIYKINHVYIVIITIHNWLVVWTPLKNISQLGWSFPICGKIKNVPNHQPDNYECSPWNLDEFGDPISAWPKCWSWVVLVMLVPALLVPRSPTSATALLSGSPSLGRSTCPGSYRSLFFFYYSQCGNTTWRLCPNSNPKCHSDDLRWSQIWINLRIMRNCCACASLETKSQDVSTFLNSFATSFILPILERPSVLCSKDPWRLSQLLSLISDDWFPMSC